MLFLFGGGRKPRIIRVLKRRQDSVSLVIVKLTAVDEVEEAAHPARVNRIERFGGYLPVVTIDRG